jgi:putative ATP-dependent endonuclease of OLD family
MSKVTGRIQNIFNRIKPLKRQGLGLNTDKENSSDFASRVLKLSGIDGFDILRSGYGTQFSTLLILSILEKLVRLKQNKRFRKFEEKRDFFTREEYQVFEAIYLEDKNKKLILNPVTRQENNKYYIDYKILPNEEIEKLGDALIDHIIFRKHISMILGLDEPEIHLHPYSQRNLIKYIIGILENKDMDFAILLKEYFDIDLISGQILIVSHAPTALSNDYREFVRFYKNKTIDVVSGKNLNLDHNAEKHLLLNLPYIKEAFFAKCVILIEGDTELGAIPAWASKIIGDLDDLGIIAINAGSCSSIPPIAHLLDHFKIPHVSIIDKDSNNDKNPKYTSINGLRTTLQRDFEEELYETIYLTDNSVIVLFDFLEDYGDRGLQRYVQDSGLANAAKTYSIPETWDPTKKSYTFDEIKSNADKNLTKAAFLAWMTRDQIKTITLGRAFGYFLESNHIPNTYKQLLLDAKQKV